MIIPKVGLALASGCARGMANIGVLQVLVENGIPIDCLAGSSAGAVVGAMYGAGYSPKEIEDFGVALTNRKLIDWAMPLPRWGFVKGDKIYNMLRHFLASTTFAQLHLPLAVVATELSTGRCVSFAQGNVAEAVRASVAIPGVMVPQKINGGIYVDGSVTQPIPVAAVQSLGADFVIAVNLHQGNHGQRQVNGIYHVIMHSLHIMERQTINEAIALADVVISPEIGKYNWKDFSHSAQMIQAGRLATEMVIDDIKAKILPSQGLSEIEVS